MTIGEHFYNRMEDIEEMMIMQDHEGLDNYGLSLTYNPDDDEWTWLLSWGGPSEEIVMKGRGNNSRFYYIYKDWFTRKEYSITSPMEEVALKTLFNDWFNCQELYDVLQ